jgi:hypothetical protein
VGSDPNPIHQFCGLVYSWVPGGERARYFGCPIGEGIVSKKNASVKPLSPSRNQSSAKSKGSGTNSNKNSRDGGRKKPNSSSAEVKNVKLPSGKLASGKISAAAKPTNDLKSEIAINGTLVNHDQKREPSRALIEVFAILLAIVAVFYLVAIVSFWAGHTSGTSNQAGGAINWMGKSGHLVAQSMISLFGWGALVPGGLLAFLSAKLWHAAHDTKSGGLEVKSHSGRGQATAGVLGMGAVLVSSSALLYLFFGKHAGGSVGEGIGGSLLPLFNQAGSALILWLVALFGYCITFRVPLSSALHEVMSGLLAVLFLPIVAVRSYLCHAARKRKQAIAQNGFHSVDEAGSLQPSSVIALMPDQRLYQPALKRSDEDLPKATKLNGDAIRANVSRSEPIKVQRGTAEDDALKDLARTMRVAKASGVGSKSGKPYQLPAVDLLYPARIEAAKRGDDDAILNERLKLIEAKLADFGIQGKGVAIHSGPVITLFEFEPAPGVKINRIASLQDDLAMSLKAASIRIIAPLPKKGTVGIEVPNSHREMVLLRDVLESAPFTASDDSLPIGLGKDIYGTPVVADIAKMPHLLIAGATGTGKSVCINSVLLSLLYRCSPDELGLILIDPKILELSVYEGIPHLKVPVVTNPKMARAVLEWAVQEMDKRYRLLQRYGVRNIDGYNRIVKGEGEGYSQDEPVIEDDVSSAEEREPLLKEFLEPLDKIVIVIDELADLMLSVGKEVEDLIARLAQKARAAGIHLIVATQRPSVDVITGLIKANFPVRISFRVTSKIDSRTILDSMGSEKLLGKGDMLMMAPAEIPITRIHGAFVSDDEVNTVIASIKAQAAPRYDQSIIEACERALTEEKTGNGHSAGEEEYDALYDEAVQFVIEQGKASTSMVQRKFKIGYNRAARIVELMEQEGVVGAADGAKPRQILVASMDL